MNNYVSVRQVIDKLLAVKTYAKDYQLLDTLTWIEGAIRSIKGGVHVMDVCCLKEVNDYMTTYPENNVRIRNIYYENQLLERKQYVGNNIVIPNQQKDSNEIHQSFTYTSSYFDELLKQLQVRENIIDSNYDISQGDLLEKVGNNISYLAGILRTEKIDKSKHWFDDNPKCIRFSFEKGYVVFDYKKWVTDDEGLPMIYDNHEYKECLFYYCLYMNELSNDRFNEARSHQANYEIYLGRAINQIRRMTDKQATQFADNWTNLLFNLNDKPFHQN